MFDFSQVTVTDFKNYFDRHFEFATAQQPDDKTKIRDVDITNAFQQASLNFNKKIFDKDADAKLAFLFLTAHYLCMDMRMAESGLSSSGTFALSSKSVGDVSASYAIPQSYLNSPLLSYFTTTEFGLKYISLLYPRMVGSYSVVFGTTTAR